MQVKGTGLITTRDFVKTNFKNDFTKWLYSLPGSSQELYTGPIDSTKWFPMQDGYIIPVDKVVELFYNGDVRKGGEELGRFSANKALTGVYRTFMVMASPMFLMKRASKIFSTFYNPSQINVFENGKKEIFMQITEFPQSSPAVEYRIAGWCAKALEMSKCNDVTFELSKSLSKNDKMTEIIYRWK